MPLRSILQIDVDDKAFKAHHEAFAKYRESLDKMPLAWKSVNAAAKGASVTIEDMAALMLAQNEHMVSLIKAQNAFGRATQNSAHHMGLLDRAASNISRHIGLATRDLLKWGTISAAATGLLGLGSLWGIEGLASSATASRMRARGLGMQYGMPEAFGVEYAPYLTSPDQMLQGMLSARTDMRSDQFRAMMMLGFAPGARVNPADVVNRTADWARRTPELLLGPMAESTGIGSMFPIQDLMGLKSLDPKERADAYRRLHNLAEQARLSDELVKKWQDLDVVLGESKLRIKTSFIDTLNELAPSIKDASKAFTDAAVDFLKSDTFKEWVGDATEAIKQFAIYMKDPQFKKNVEEAAGVIRDFARVVWDATKFIASMLPAGKTLDSTAQGANDLGRWMGDKLGTSGFVPWFEGTQVGKWFGGLFNGGGTGPSGEDVAGLPGGGKALASRWLAAGSGIDPLDLISRWEDPSGDPTAKNPRSSASGLWQMLDSTWAEWSKRVFGASGYAHAGNAPAAIQRAVAQALYNAQGFSPWESYNPWLHSAVDKMQTVGSRSQQLGMNSGGVRIIIQNNTGGSAHVSASMLSQVA
jgi:hypothetical protein